MPTSGKLSTSMQAALEAYRAAAARTPGERAADEQAEIAERNRLARDAVIAKWHARHPESLRRFPLGRPDALLIPWFAGVVLAGFFSGGVPTAIGAGILAGVMVLVFRH